MHFRCICGNTIWDTTDHLYYKASMLADQDYGDLIEEIEKFVSDETLDANARMDHIMGIWTDYQWRHIYQCDQCGRVIIEGPENLYFFAPEFSPERTEGKHLLTSVKAEDWEGCLHGEWDEEKESYWREHQGYISADTNDETIPRWQDYDSREELERDYYKIFEKLREAGRIRSALLKIGRERVHDWPPRPQ